MACENCNTNGVSYFFEPTKKQKKKNRSVGFIICPTCFPYEAKLIELTNTMRNHLTYIKKVEENHG